MTHVPFLCDAVRHACTSAHIAWALSTYPLSTSIFSKIWKTTYDTVVVALLPLHLGYIILYLYLVDTDQTQKWICAFVLSMTVSFSGLVVDGTLDGRS